MSEAALYCISRTKCPGQVRRDVNGMVLTWWSEDDADAYRLALPEPDKWYVRKLAGAERRKNRSTKPKRIMEATK